VLIDSLRDVNEVDEQIFLEQFSYIESVLLKDPARVYIKMDTTSRAMYRSVVIKLSKKYKVKEKNVVTKCLKLAMKGNVDILYANHVGTYLLGKGYSIL
jgi:hypothetical protein